MDLFAELRQKYSPAITSSCNKGGCKLGVESFSPHPIIIDCDKYAQTQNYQGTICDYFVFPITAKIIVAVVEMKGRIFHSSQALGQIRAGAAEAERIVGFRAVAEFYPILLSISIRHAAELKVLQRSKIGFKGKNYSLIYKKCGVQLAAVMADYR